MKILTVLCNIVLLAFTIFVLATDGLPKAGTYIVFTVALVLVPVFTLYARLCPEASKKPAVGRAAAVANLVLLAMVVWALADQSDHPADPGFIPYVIACVVVPVLNAVPHFLRARRQDH